LADGLMAENHLTSVSAAGGLPIGARGADVREPLVLFCWRTG
jgi:hypothetical protein